MRATLLADPGRFAEGRAGRLAPRAGSVYDGGMKLCASTLAALLAGLLAAGCGGGRGVAEKQIEELRAQISKLRAEQAALTDRLERAEIELRSKRQLAPTPAQQAAAASVSADPRPATVDRPELDVVRLGPEADNDDPDADTPRPVVRASGNSGVIQERAGGKVLVDDRKEGGDADKKKPPPSWAKKKKSP